MRSLLIAALLLTLSLHAQTLQQLEQLARTRPQHPLIGQAYARALAKEGRGDEAMAALRRVLALSVATDLADHDFDSIRSRDDFHALEQSVDELRHRRVSRASIRFHLPKDLLTEAIAYDPKTKSFFVSANRPRKIIRIDARGRVSEFVKPMHGFWGANGLAVDTKRRLLWASSRAIIRGGNVDAAQAQESAVWAFDLDRGEVLNRFKPPANADALDDLTLASDGTLYVSDSQGAVLTLPPGGKELLPLVPRGGPIRSSQGETIHGRLLYVADYGRGVAVVDRQTHDVAGLALPADFPAFGIDGLAYANGWLYGVQNGVEPNRVVRLHLAPGGLRADRWEIVEMNHPLMDEPTIGAVVAGDEYVFLAASQGNKFDDNKLDQLHDSIVMRFKP